MAIVAYIQIIMDIGLILDGNITFFIPHCNELTINITNKHFSKLNNLLILISFYAFLHSNF